MAIGTAQTLIDHPEYFPSYDLFAIEDDGAVVGCGWMTPSRLRIRRRGGHDSNLLDAGRELCFLRTDLANPTSNSIYQRLGYRPVSDTLHIGFSPS